MTSNLCCFVSLNMSFQTSRCFWTLKSMYSMYANSSPSVALAFVKMCARVRSEGRARLRKHISSFGSIIYEYTITLML